MLYYVRLRAALFFWALGDLFDPAPPSPQELASRTALRPGENLSDYVRRVNRGEV